MCNLLAISSKICVPNLCLATADPQSCITTTSDQRGTLHTDGQRFVDEIKVTARAVYYFNEKHAQFIESSEIDLNNCAPRIIVLIT